MTGAVSLPDGRRAALGPGMADRLLCGVMVLDPVVVDDRTGPGDAAEVLGLAYRERWAGAKPSQIEELGEARRLYRSCGMEPTRHRPSSEALLRRTLQGKGLYRINNVVDACNLASLTFLLPVGMYDLARVHGDVTLRLGTAEEQYAGIRKGPVHLEGRLGLFDAEGPFGSPTSDSDRTCTREDTTSLLAVIMATPGYGEAAMEAALDVFASAFREHAGATMVLQAVLGGNA